jgi:hypothetical protein
MNDFIFRNLPVEIINYILDYTGKLYYHNGKYIGKIDIKNIKYMNIHRIPKPIKISPNKFIIYLINRTKLLGYILYYEFSGIKTFILLQFIIYEDKDDRNDKKPKLTEKYSIPRVYSKWRRLISYKNF